MGTQMFVDTTSLVYVWINIKIRTHVFVDTTSLVYVWIRIWVQDM